MIEDRDLRAALESLATARLKGAAPTLSDEELASYVAGDLDAEEKERVQAILTASPKMRARLLALRRGAGLPLSADEDSPIEVLSEAEKEREIEKLKARLGIQEGAHLAAPPRIEPAPVTSIARSKPAIPVPAAKNLEGIPNPGSRKPDGLRFLRRAASIAVAFLAGALILAGLQIQAKNAELEAKEAKSEDLQAKLQAKQEPTGFVDVRYLTADGTTRGSDVPPAQVGEERARLLLQLASRGGAFEDPPPGPYRLEIVDRRQPNREVLWSQDDFPAEPDGSFHLLLDRDFLQPGKYQVKVLAPKEGQGMRVYATYSFDF